MLRCSHTEPARTAPQLVLPTTESGSFDLHASPFQGYTLLLFHRGLACDVCQLYIAKLAVLLKRQQYPRLRVVLVSAENASIAEHYRSLLRGSQLTVLHSLSRSQTEAWGVDQPHTRVAQPAAVILDSQFRYLRQCTFHGLEPKLPRLTAIQATLRRLERMAVKSVPGGPCTIEPTKSEPSTPTRSLQTVWQRPHIPPASVRLPHGGCSPATYGVPPSPC